MTPAQLSRSSAARVRAYRDAVEFIDPSDPSDALEVVVRALGALCGLERPMGYSLEILPNGSFRVDGYTSGLPSESRSGFAGWIEASQGPYALFDPQRPAVEQRNRVMEVGTWEQIRDRGEGTMVSLAKMRIRPARRRVVLDNLQRGDTLNRPDFAGGSQT